MASGSRQAINTDAAPPPVGPYSQSILSNGFLFVAGQLGVDPATKKLAGGGIAAQTEQALKNLQAIVEAAGASLDSVVKTTVFMADFNEFAQMNAVYATFFGGEAPARSTFQVARLPLDGAVEIEAIVSVAK